MNIFKKEIYCDWRKIDAVTATKNQNPCCSCWAFATIAALESYHFIHTNELIKFSEQHLIDCGHTQKQHLGLCNAHGGYFADAFYAILRFGGIYKSSDYNWRGDDEQECHNVPGKQRYYSGGREYMVTSMSFKNNQELMEQIRLFNPVAANIKVPDDWETFKDDKVYDKICPYHINHDHSLEVVGYDVDEKNRPYWILKNSWVATCTRNSNASVPLHFFSVKRK